MLGSILIVVLILALLGALPFFSSWSFSSLSGAFIESRII